MKATVPTALHLDDNTESFLTPYAPGKLNSTYVSGEMGFNRMGVTFPFPEVMESVPGTSTTPLNVVRVAGDVAKRSILANANYGLVFNPTTKIATVTGEIGLYTKAANNFLPANGNYIAISIAFPDILSADVNYDLMSLKVGAADALTIPPILSAQEKADEKVFILLPVVAGNVGNSIDIVIKWNNAIAVETIKIAFDAGVTLAV